MINFSYQTFVYVGNIAMYIGSCSGDNTLL